VPLGGNRHLNTIQFACKMRVETQIPIHAVVKGTATLSSFDESDQEDEDDGTQGRNQETAN
jgi:hypothetical protein